MSAEATARAEQPPSEPLAFHGVTLEQYAGITVAVADAYPLDAALANDGIAKRAWAKAEIAWKERLAADGASGPLFSDYCEKRIEAEDWLERKVTPLDVDLEAWLAFLHAWSTHAAPFDLLAGAGLRMSDMARLKRRWDRRMEDEPALKKQAAEIMARGARSMPRINAEAGELKPFQWSKGSPPAPEPEALPAPASASLAAPLPVVVPTPVVVSTPLMRPAPASISALAGTALALNVPRGPALPFVEGAPSIAVSAPSRSPVMRADPGLGGTAMALDIPRGPALPFEKEAATPEPAGPPVARADPGLAGTAMALDIPRGPALPFKEESEPSPLAAPSSTPLPAVRKAPAGLAGTSMALNVPRGPALPFKKEEGEPSAAAAPSATPLPAVRPAPAALAGTSMALDIPRGPALPFKGEPDAPPPVPAPASVPEPVSVTAPASVSAPVAAPAPLLTIEQHASLWVELTASPARAAETLARYRLTAAQRDLVDQHYRERFAKEPALRARWDAAYRAYADWLAKAKPPRT